MASREAKAADAQAGERVEDEPPHLPNGILCFVINKYTIYIYIYIYILIYLFIYLYIHTYIHTHTYIYTYDVHIHIYIYIHTYMLCVLRCFSYASE